MIKLGSHFARYFKLSSSNRWNFARDCQYMGDETLLMYLPTNIFIYLDARDASLTPSLLLKGAWEPAIGMFLNANLRLGGCFIDIGANNGIHALRAASLVGPEGIVLAFEPQQRLFNLIQRSICANLFLDRMHSRRIIIGAESGVGQLGKFDYLTGSASLTPNEQITQHEEAPMSPLPEMLSQVEREIGRSMNPDIIKIDVEGFECHVWDGMRDWARLRENLSMIVEYSPVSYRNLGRDPLDILSDVAACGFSISSLLPDGKGRALSHDELVNMSQSYAQFDLLFQK